MTTTAPDATTHSDHVRCGCCGRSLPARRVHELGDTPGVYLCARCALWVAGQLSRFPVVHLDPRRLLRRGRRVGRRRGHDAAVRAVPVLASADLDRTRDYYASLGFRLVERHEHYLVMHSGGTELHFSSRPDTPAVVAFLQVVDAGALWKRLRSDGVAGLGPIEDQPWGLREFVITDPSGNRLRVASSIPEDA
jgi:catechol 2,3-dioxygenase-like lactoylglutathione lyase family enzyme